MVVPPAASDTGGEPVTVTVDTKLRVFVKHAYLEAKSDAAHLKLRAGIIDTPYGPYYDSFVGMRYVSDSFSANTKIISTADFGVGVMVTQGKGASPDQIASGQGIPLEHLQYGTAVVLIGLVLMVNSVSIGLRVYLRSRKKW
mgnify:CR=1 FL=1